MTQKIQIMLMGKRYLADLDEVKAMQADLTNLGTMVMRCKADGSIERIVPEHYYNTGKSERLERALRALVNEFEKFSPSIRNGNDALRYAKDLLHQEG
jgi:hypothetical protein